MRIRKHAHIPPLVNGGSAQISQSANKYPYVCQLNQSPWDILTFPLPDFDQQHEGDEDPAAAQLLPPLPQPPPPPPPPFDGEVSSMDNGSISDSPEPDNSGLSLKFEKWGEEINAGEIEFEGNRKLGSVLGKKMIIAPRRSNNHRRVQQVKKRYKLVKKAVAKNNSRVVRAKKATTTVSASNPYEYYYYSGFGPRWGSRTRRGKPVEDSLINIPIRDTYNMESLQNDNDVAADATTTDEVDKLARVFELKDSKPVQMSNYMSGFEDDEDEDDDDDDEQFVKVKRARKPVKARSLKSLM